MKRSILYTAVFSAMLMVTGCGGGDGSSTSDDKGQSTQLEKTPIKQNQLYGANIDGVSSYYLDDGQNQVSYFHENNLWHGVVKNKEGKTKFSFSEDLTEFFAFNDRENQTLRIKQIDNQTIYQTVIDSLGVTIESVAYFQEGNKFFIAPLNGTEIDKTQKIDITQAYQQGGQQAQNTTNYSASAKVANVLSMISSQVTIATDSMIASRSFTFAKKVTHPCALWGDVIKNVGGAFLTAGVIIVAAPIILPVAAQFVATATVKTGLSIAVGAVIGWKAAEIDSKNQKARDELAAIKNELAKEEEKAKNERKQCLAGETLVGGVCKKVEPICDVGETLFYGICTKKVEPQCSVGEIFINGACKKIEPICDVGETLINGVCKKEEQKCATDENIVNGVCKKVEPICDVDEKLVDGVCKKEEPTCLIGETLVNGVCKEINTKGCDSATSYEEMLDKECFSGTYKYYFTKISEKGQKLPHSAKDWNCALDTQTGLMWQLRTSESFRSDYKYTWFEDSFGYADLKDALSGTYVGEGLSYGDQCGHTLAKCNTKAFVEKANKEKICGYSDWRLPHKNELEDLSAKGLQPIHAVPFYTTNVWSSSSVEDNNREAWALDFYYSGKLVRKGKGNALGVVVVRDAF
ncbi:MULTISPECIES: Lcl C-terminal domain-containing protein [Acinetobacter]|uniref:DUF1566 domain-containing protein n=1 Tax=Acinetobacter corruptisaponis TaxID=3045147 RepID=A0ABY8S2M0_9GAMM|nr:DUF1566 domain-containing protein [Acinetobacter sp. KCTC 92772]WHP05571.1 DUF1566 domain-containing protein [Acinetobacter sp. KCTC 92772]